MVSDRPLVIALGGNALILPGEKGFIEEQFEHTRACMKPIASLIRGGGRVVITHGNGPVVGNILLRNECARSYIPPMPLSICVADSQGGIGTMMVQSLITELRGLGISRSVIAFLTHVFVDIHDDAFRNPTKPIGPYYAEDRAMYFLREEHWRMREIPGKGWRRLVPSPRPIGILELDAIRAAIEQDMIPIATGGGGIPLIEERGGVKAVDAVVDKDLSASLLARELGSRLLVILTDVDGVYLRWGTEERQKLHHVSVKEVKSYLEEGHFPPGDMGPKIEAAVEFVEAGGEAVIIGRPEELLDALTGRAGTRITA